MLLSWCDRSMKARLEMAKFLQKCVSDDIERLREETQEHESSELSEAIDRLRSGKSLSKDKLMKLVHHFQDDFLIDNYPRPQLLAMCRFLNISGPFGPDIYVRFLLRSQIQAIRKDDKEIHWEGIDSLDDEELRAACEMRGIRTMTSDRRKIGPYILRPQLKEWLSLSIQQDLPVSFLIFSRAFAYTRETKDEQERKDQKLEAAVASLPDDVVDELIVEEGKEISRERKLQLINAQEKL
eukprot:SAG31_NODE_5854_length_2293_cov_1.420237_1_plen_238_part_10